MLINIILIGMFYDLYWISCSLSKYLFLCVHLSLWTYILMIGVYSETYTHEIRYILSWYSNSLMTTTFYCFWFFLWFLKGIFSMSSRFILLHLLALIFGGVYLHSYASLTIFQICFFTLNLGTSFDFSFGIFFPSK